MFFFITVPMVFEAESQMEVLSENLSLPNGFRPPPG